MPAVAVPDLEGVSSGAHRTQARGPAFKHAQQVQGFTAYAHGFHVSSIHSHGAFAALIETAFLSQTRPQLAQTGQGKRKPFTWYHACVLRFLTPRASSLGFLTFQVLIFYTRTREFRPRFCTTSPDRFGQGAGRGTLVRGGGILFACLT